MENGDGLVEVVVFHGGGAVENCEWSGALHHERVRLASVIQIVTQTRHEHAKHLQHAPVSISTARDITSHCCSCSNLDWFELCVGSLDDRVHGVGDGEGVCPVVVRNRAVVLAHSQ